jgi:hypothetical protein
MFLIGGELNGDKINSTYQIALKPLEIKEKKPSLIRRSSAAICSLSYNNFIVMAGKKEGGETCNSVEYYSIKENEWTSLPDIKTTISDPNPICINTIIYAVESKEGKIYKIDWKAPTEWQQINFKKDPIIAKIFPTPYSSDKIILWNESSNEISGVYDINNNKVSLINSNLLWKTSNSSNTQVLYKYPYSYSYSELENSPHAVVGSKCYQAKCINLMTLERPTNFSITCP